MGWKDLDPLTIWSYRGVPTSHGRVASYWGTLLRAMLFFGPIGLASAQITGLWQTPSGSVVEIKQRAGASFEGRLVRSNAQMEQVGFHKGDVIFGDIHVGKNSSSGSGTIETIKMTVARRVASSELREKCQEVDVPFEGVVTSNGAVIHGNLLQDVTFENSQDGDGSVEGCKASKIPRRLPFDLRRPDAGSAPGAKDGERP